MIVAMDVKKTSMYNGLDDRLMVVANTVRDPRDTLNSLNTRTSRTTRNTDRPGMATPAKTSSSQNGKMATRSTQFIVSLKYSLRFGVDHTRRINSSVKHAMQDASMMNHLDVNAISCS